MSGESSPKNWTAAIDNFVWVGLVSACAVVAIERAVEQQYGQTLAALLLSGALAAIYFHVREWVSKINPNFGYLSAAILTLAVISMPFIEEKQWPFAAWFKMATADEIATIVADKMTEMALINHIPSAANIGEASVQKLPAAENDSAQVAALQKQLAVAQRTAQTANQEATATRAQLVELQRQQQATSDDQFTFPPFPIKKRKFTPSEAIELINKLPGFSTSINLLDQPMSQPLFLTVTPGRFPSSQVPASLDLDQESEMAIDISKKMNSFSLEINRNISSNPNFKAEIDDMLGGSDWFELNSFDQLIQALENCSQLAKQLSTRPTKPDPELTGYIMRDSRRDLLLRAKRFNSWRSQIPKRIEELKNEARGDL